MVPLYVRTDGRLRPRPEVRVETLLVAASGPTETLNVDARRVMGLFAKGRGGLSVAEIAAALELPLTTVLILVSTLMNTGHLASPTRAPESQPDIDILWKMLDGLRKLPA